MSEPVERTPEATQAAAAPAAPPPVEDPYTPVDDSEDVEPSVPEPEPKPAAPEPPKHSRKTLRMAHDLGLSQAQINSATPEQLDDFVYDANRAAMHRVAEAARQEAIRQAQQQRQAPAPVPETLGIDESQFDPQLIGAIKGVKAEYKQHLGQLSQQLQYTQQILAQQTQAQQQAIAAQQQAAIHNQLDAAFASRPEIVGKGPASGLKPGSPELQRRLAAIAVAQNDQQGGTLEDKIGRAMEALYGPKDKEPEVAPAVVERWNKGALARTTQRNSPPEAPGPKKAAKAVNEFLKKRGYDSSNVNFDAEEETLA